MSTPQPNGVALACITGSPLDVNAHIVATDRTDAGAVATFIGRVRDHDPDASGRVSALEYRAHPDAERTLRAITEHAVRDTDACAAVSHRTGTLAVGEIAVVVAVSSAHRGEAFAVCRAVIEAIKTDLPVWKRQTDARGTAIWKGL